MANLWSLAWWPVIVEFFDWQDASNPLNGAKIDGAAGVLRLLNSFPGRRPFFAEFIGENGFNLLVGIGASTGCVQYSASGSAAPYLMAVNPDADDPSRVEVFLIGNSPTPVRVRYCLPIETVRELAGHFAQTGEISPTVAWEEV